MLYGYMPGLEQAKEQIVVAKERRIGGHAIGILLLDVLCPMLPGDVANAGTYNFPVLYKVLNGVGVEQVFRADPTVLEELVRGGKELERQGVRAITSDCGYFGNYQKEVAAALDIPVFLSSLLQIPLISLSLKPSQKVGVICADSRSLSSSLLRACGVHDPSSIVVAGAEELPESKNLGLCTGRYDSSKMEQELVSLAKQLINDNPHIGAILLECSDLPPYAWSIQRAVNIPVFDFTTMISWIYTAVVRHPFAGFV
jgi:hypothetical protein